MFEEAFFYCEKNDVPKAPTSVCSSVFSIRHESTKGDNTQLDASRDENEGRRVPSWGGGTSARDVTPDLSHQREGAAEVGVG